MMGEYDFLTGEKMSSNNSWLRVLGIIVLSLLILGAVAFVAYRVGFNQGAGFLTQGVQPPNLISPRGDWFGRHMPMYDGRFSHPMMRFGWHFFHPGLWLGFAALLLIVFLLVKVFSNQPVSSSQGSTRRSTRK
jgi:hypothetical protein